MQKSKYTIINYCILNFDKKIEKKMFKKELIFVQKEVKKIMFFIDIF